MTPEFEESQFAALYQDSVSRRALFPRNRVVLAPVGQVLEAEIGFDFAWWIPRRHRLWSVFDIPGLPGVPRAVWGPTLGEPVSITGKALNLFFQFKRSDYLYGNNAPHRKYFENRPYWRFEVDRSLSPRKTQSQHQILEDLEATVGDSALVRYVAPRFHKFSTLESLASRRAVAERCVYVAPSDFAPAHTAYHFTSSRQLVNPDAEPREPSTWMNFMEQLGGALADISPEAEPFTSVADAFSDFGLAQPSDLGYPWRLPADTPEYAREVLTPLLPVARFLFENHIAWFVGIDWGPAQTVGG